MRLLIKDASKNEARESTKSPAREAAQKVHKIEAVGVWARGVVLQNRELGSALEKREEMRLARWTVPRI
jgi:hypothetical protein